MQQKERRGAWVLFVAILVFGALVWGYGGYQRDKERNLIELASERDDAKADSDSVKVPKESHEKKTNKPMARRKKSGRSNTEPTPARDILGDEVDNTARHN